MLIDVTGNMFSVCNMPLKNIWRNTPTSILYPLAETYALGGHELGDNVEECLGTAHHAEQCVLDIVSL